MRRRRVRKKMTIMILTYVILYFEFEVVVVASGDILQQARNEVGHGKIVTDMYCDAGRGDEAMEGGVAYSSS
jgi:hypothetical protein